MKPGHHCGGLKRTFCGIYEVKDAVFAHSCMHRFHWLLFRLRIDSFCAIHKLNIYMWRTVLHSVTHSRKTQCHTVSLPKLNLECMETWKPLIWWLLAVQLAIGGLLLHCIYCALRLHQYILIPPTPLYVQPHCNHTCNLPHNKTA